MDLKIAYLGLETPILILYLKISKMTLPKNLSFVILNYSVGVYMHVNPNYNEFV
jgi:hypothetical protein